MTQQPDDTLEAFGDYTPTEIGEMTKYDLLLHLYHNWNVVDKKYIRLILKTMKEYETIHH